MYIAMDMGTTNTRLWLIDGDKTVDQRKLSLGARVGRLEGKSVLFSRLKEGIDELLLENGLCAETVECIITSGMSGSEMALCEVAHLDIPMDAYSEATRLFETKIPEITDIPFLFVPGLKKTAGGELSDIMRGEETEVFGILEAMGGEGECVILLPGTHNKIIAVNKSGEICDFTTTMSGEILDLAVNGSILKGAVSHSFEVSEADVLRGAEYSREKGVNAALFHVRVMEKNGATVNSLSSFLYGAVLGEDRALIRSFANGKRIYVGGGDTLKRIYGLLLETSHALPLKNEMTGSAVLTGLRKIYAVHKANSEREKVKAAVERERLISIIRAPERDSLIASAQALYEGGVRLFEITYDRSGSISREEISAMIKSLCEAFRSRAHIGAGTVTSIEDVEAAFLAGAEFIISPNCDPEIISHTRRLGMVSIPAAYTPTEIAEAIKRGADFVKLFPADGVSREYVKAVLAPLSDAKLLAVGGVSAENAKDFLAMGFVGVGVGSNLYDKKLVKCGDLDGLTALAKKYTAALK